MRLKFSSKLGYGGCVTHIAKAEVVTRDAHGLVAMAVMLSIRPRPRCISCEVVTTTILYSLHVFGGYWTLEKRRTIFSKYWVQLLFDFGPRLLVILQARPFWSDGPQ